MIKKLLTFALPALLLFVVPDVSFAAYGVQAKTSGCIANKALQDPGCTPGAVLTTNTATICKVGYTKTVRNVPLSVTKKVFAEYGIPYSSHSNYEVDHLISLELGGSNDISNLWPEPRNITSGALSKDKIENSLHSQVCNGKMTIQIAQAAIATNWTTANNPIQPAKAKAVVVPVTTIKVAPTVVNPTSLVPAIVGPGVKKSTTGICHARGTTYYDRTIYFTAYSTVDTCLASGGRLPK